MRVVVCGAGQVGTTIARHLASEGNDVTVVDNDPDAIRRINESYDVRGVVGHASHPASLREASARDADMLIAVTRSDEVNMVACHVASSLFDVKQRIARLRHGGYVAPNSAGLYAAAQMPIDVIISPEMEIAEGVMRRLRTPGAFDMAPLAGGRIELLGIHAEDQNAPAIGERLADLPRDDLYAAMRVVTVIRKGRPFVPDEDDRVEVGDDLYVLAKTGRTSAIMTAFGHRERLGRKLVIVGAGNVGFHLARQVKRSASGVDLKVIEANRRRAQYVARELGGAAIVLQGDALDRALLHEAQAGLAETIVAVTNDDETNIFTSVLAKQAGCRRAITLVNKRSYEALMPMLGIDSVISPSEVTISTVLRHVRKGVISALYTLREDFGEIVEAEICSDSRLLQRPLGQLGLPVGIRVAAMVRQGEVSFPEHDTRFAEGDHIVMLVTYQSLHLAEALLRGRGKRAG